MIPVKENAIVEKLLFGEKVRSLQLGDGGEIFFCDFERG